MRGALGGPRVLLRRLREVMAEPVSAQDRLDKMVVLIAANMVAEVCSVYVLARRRNARAIRHRRSEARGGPPDRAEGRRGPGRPGRQRSQSDQPVGRAGAPGLLVPAGNRRRNLPLVPRRADPARRQYARRAGGAEPRAAHLHRGGRRGAADHGDGARRDDRLRRAVRARPPRRRAGRAPRAQVQAPRCPTASRSATWCCTSRASSSPMSSPTTCRRNSSGWTRPSPRSAPISTACSSTATSPKAASIARCSKPTACSPTTRAGCTRCARR